MCSFLCVLFSALLTCAPIDAMGRNALVQEVAPNYARELDTVLYTQWRECATVSRVVDCTLRDIVRGIAWPCRIWNCYFWLSDLMTEENLQRIYNALPNDIRERITSVHQSDQDDLREIELQLKEKAITSRGQLYFWISSGYDGVYKIFKTYICGLLVQQGVTPLYCTLRTQGARLQWLSEQQRVESERLQRLFEQQRVESERLQRLSDQQRVESERLQRLFGQLQLLSEQLQTKSRQLESLCNGFCSFAQSVISEKQALAPQAVVANIGSILRESCGQDLMQITRGRSAELSQLSFQEDMECDLVPEEHAVKVHKSHQSEDASARNYSSPKNRASPKGSVSPREEYSASYNTDESDNESDEQIPVDTPIQSKPFKGTVTPSSISQSSALRESVRYGTITDRMEEEQQSAVSVFRDSIQLTQGGEKTEIGVNARILNGTMLICKPEIFVRDILFPFSIERVVLAVDVNFFNGEFKSANAKNGFIVTLKEEKGKDYYLRTDRSDVSIGILKHHDNSISYDTSKRKVVYKVGSDEYTFHNDGTNAILTGPCGLSKTIGNDTAVWFSLEQGEPCLFSADKMQTLFNITSIQELDLRPLSQEEGEQ